MYRDEFRNAEKEFYWSAPRVVLASIVALIVLYGIGFLMTGGDLAIYRFWAPKQEAARREVYEQTKSYRQGSVQRLATLCTQATEADESHRPMLNDVISHEFAEWDATEAPAYLRPCLRAARGGK